MMQSVEQRLAALAALKSEVTDEPLHKAGRYFDESCHDLAQCNHGDPMNYGNHQDGEAIALLWNLWREGALVADDRPRASDSVVYNDAFQMADDLEGWFPSHNVSRFANMMRDLACEVRSIRMKADTTELSELLQALRPFANFAKAGSFDHLPDDMPMTQGSRLAHRQVTAGDFKRALIAASNRKAIAR